MTELQKKVLQLLEDIDKLCRENDIDYYLTAGTLLGAVRHKGFIPWDDDADIIMTRDNWNKFLTRTAGKLPEGIVLNTQDEDAGLAMTANHYVDTKTAAIYRYDLTNPERTGIMIDIIIMDPVPEGEHAKKTYIDALTRHTELTSLPYQYSLRIGETTHFSYYWFLSKILGKRAVLNKIDKEAFHYSEENAQYYVQRFAGSPHFWDKEYFGKPRYVPFENIELPIPQRAGDCLCIGFDDDWQYVPSGGVTKSTHEFCVRSMTVSGEQITKDFEKRINRRFLMQTYIKRKKIQVAQTNNKFRVSVEADLFIAAKIQQLYDKKRTEEDFQKYLITKDYDALKRYFGEYIQVQCSNRFIGSSSLTGWINWYRKCHPLLIDIGDNELFAVIALAFHEQHLAWVGKLLKARKALDRPMTDELLAMDSLYQGIKKAVSAYECEEDALCRETVDLLLPQYPDNPFLYKLDLKLKIRKGMGSDELYIAADKGLECFPDDSELQYFKAEACLKRGERSKALEIFEHLSESSNHGLVLTQTRETLERLIEESPDDYILYKLWLQVRRQLGEEELPSIEDLMPRAENITDPAEEASYTPYEENNEIHELTNVQKKRYQLLTEVADICEANHIKYFLFGKTLWQAAKNGVYSDLNGELTIAMLPEDCRKFTDIFLKQNRTDRYLDSMQENPWFHRFCLRYCDSESLDFPVERSGCGDRFGIFITIEVLRSASRSKAENLLNQMLESGWESSVIMKWTSPKRWISRMFVSGLCAVLGRRRVGKWLYHRFMKTPANKNTERYFIKPFWDRRKFFPSYLFRFTAEMPFENRKFTVMKMSDLYLKTNYGKNWKVKAISQTAINPFTRIIDPELPSREYLSYLQQKKIDRTAIWRHRRKTDRKYAKAITLGGQTAKYWDIMSVCGERYRLYEKYMPMRTYLAELYRSNNIAELASVLKDYSDTAIYYGKKGLGICFDKSVFELLEYTLLSSGKRKQAKLIRRGIPNQDWKPMKMEHIKIGGGYGMRSAKETDIPAILTHLKRHIADCLYMYIDIKKYGLENPNMKVWMDSDEKGVRLVVMKYHTSISVYSEEENWDVAAVVQIIKDEKVGSVTGRKDIIEKLHEALQDSYEASYGAVFQFTSYRDSDFDGEIETAKETDTLEIAKLITKDEGIGGYYEIEDLAAQLAERIRTNMGRSYVIRENGKIIAHIASYAEFEDLATTGGLIVDPDSRNGIYGSVLEGYLVNQLWSDGFQVYTFVTARLRKKLLGAMGNTCVGEYGKLARKH